MSSAIRIAIALAMMAISTTTSARSEVVCPPATQGDPLDRMSLFVGDPRNLVELAPVTPPSPRLGYAHISCRVRIGIRKRLRAYDAVRFGSLRQPEDTNRNGL